MLSEMGN